MKVTNNFIFALFIALAVGCDRRVEVDSRETARSQPASQPVSMSITAECLPCNGHRLEVTTSTPRTEYKAQMYYFCSEGCKEEFLKNPENFLHQATSQPATSPSTAPSMGQAK